MSSGWSSMPCRTHPGPHHSSSNHAMGWAEPSSLNRGARMNTPWKLASPPTTVKPRLERGAVPPTIALDRRAEHVTAEQDRPRTGPEDASIWVLHAPCRHRPDDVGSRRPHRGGFASR